MQAVRSSFFPLLQTNSQKSLATPGKCFPVWEHPQNVPLSQIHTPVSVALRETRSQGRTGYAIAAAAAVGEKVRRNRARAEDIHFDYNWTAAATPPARRWQEHWEADSAAAPASHQANDPTSMFSAFA